MGQFAYMSAVATEIKSHFAQWFPTINQHSTVDYGRGGNAFYFRIDAMELSEDTFTSNMADIIGNLLEAAFNLNIQDLGLYDVEVYRNDGAELTLLLNRVPKKKNLWNSTRTTP
jgi:hypothetical protein